MSRRLKAAPRTAAKPPRQNRARARLWTRALIVLVLLIAAIVSWWVWRARPRPATADPAAALAPEDAYRHAVELSTAKRYRESLIYFRRALGHAQPDFADLHLRYALALYDLTVQYTERAGRPVPATRSSVERVELARESFAELDRAAQLAASPADLAKILSYRANMLCLWGFPWDALQSYRAAQHADPTNRQLVDRADSYLSVMRDPRLLKLAGPDSAASALP